MGKLLREFAFYCKIIKMISITGILLFVVILSVITITHELGHLLVAKAFGVYCKEFSLGMGPKLYSKKTKETEYSIRALLIGGFVSMVGEQEDDPAIQELNIPKERTLKGIAKWKQICVMFAGIFMNFVTALIIYSLLMLNIGTYTIANKPIIESIRQDMPAYSSGLKEGDIVTKVELQNGTSISPETYSELTTFLLSFYDGNGPWIMTVERNGESLKYQITPEYYEAEQRYIIGITFSNVATKTVDINLLNCFKYGFIYMCDMVKMIFISLSSLFRGIGLKNLSGPVGIYQAVEQSIDYGVAYYMELVAMISVNVAMFNALPIPAFDGGRVLLLLIEVIIRRPLPKKLENAVLAASWVLILSLILFVSYNDIIKLVGGY